MSSPAGKTVFVDIDTQIDFMLPSGALYVPLAERLIPALARLNRYAAEHGIPQISTLDTHAEDDVEFRQWPHHCIGGTLAHRKVADTVVPGQILVAKGANDVFTNRDFAPLIRSLGAERSVVYGVVTEICVQCAAFGLLKMGLRVELVTDAVQHLSAGARDRMFREFTSGGGILVDSATLLA
jgi:nicotinamidase/pyrazinamidase